MIHRRHILIVLLAAALTTGCFNAESDYDRLQGEKADLAADLETAKQENEILTRALASIKQEQETLQALLRIGRSLSPGVPPSSGGAGVGLPPLAMNGQTAPAVVGVEEDDDWVQPSAAAASRAPAPAPTPAPAAPSGRVYVTKPGDVLATIARRHNTTVDVLLELNPQIRNRRNYMIWENDKIQLP